MNMIRMLLVIYTGVL